MTHVLVVDDDPDMATLLGRMATMAGYESTVVKTGNAALDIARETPPDVIVLDVMMAEADGWTIYDQLRAITAAPVVFVTAWSTKENANRARDLGEGFITKPLSPNEFAAQLQIALDRGEAT